MTADRYHYTTTAGGGRISAVKRLTGRIVVERGDRGTLTGTLVADGDEWVLEVDGELYELHLGRFGHDGETTAGMKEGAEATVKGFIYGLHISPVALFSLGATYRFREEDGRPLWAASQQDS